MELKPGYKQTEVGVIPDDWDTAIVGQSFYICNQLRLPLSRSDRNLIPGPYPYYGPTGVQGWINEYRAEGKYALIGEDGDHFLKWQAQPMTKLVEGQFNVNNHAHLVKGSRNLTEWFYWYFSNRDITTYLTRQGAGRFKLTKAALTNIPCALPPPCEQLAISKTLSEVDALLSSLEQLLCKKNQVKQAIMQELLTGKRRLPGFEGEWAQVSLGSVAAMNSGGTPPTGRDDFYGGGIPWVSISDMTSSGRFISETERTLSDLGLANCAAKRFPAGTILYAMYASLGECSVSTCEVTTSQAILGIRPSPALVSEYLYYYLCSIQGMVKQLGQQGTQSNLNKKIVQGFTFKLPKEAEQIAIANILSDIDEDIDVLNIKAEKARAMKTGMMQQLLTGKIRLR